MPTIAAYETIKGFSVFDECADDSWADTESYYGKVLRWSDNAAAQVRADTESYYGKVAESRRAYHRLPDVVRVSSKDMSGIVLFPPKQSARYSLEQEFKELAEKWRMEIEVLSSTSEIVSNFNYYRIIALGKDIVPLILQELQENGGQWYLALRVLTNQNPVNPEDVGNIKKMKMAWLNWGREHRLI